MELVHARCAGIDVSKKDAKVCVRVQGRGKPTVGHALNEFAENEPQTALIVVVPAGIEPATFRV